ncbi:hypothetical protein ETAR_10780 [Edwardsiella tarda]
MMMMIAYPSWRGDVVPKRSEIVPNRSFDGVNMGVNDRYGIVFIAAGWGARCLAESGGALLGANG